MITTEANFALSFFPMPLFYQHNINEFTKTGDLANHGRLKNFSLNKVPLKRDVSHAQKRLQHLAGRYLLTELFPDFPLEEILIADTRKPYLEDEQYHFSISHFGHYAAAIVSSTNRVGVDIELITPKIGKISHKFSSAAEFELISRTQLYLAELPVDQRSVQTMLWSAKEAIYKWYGDGLVDFKNHMRLVAQPRVTDLEWIEMSFVFEKKSPVHLIVNGRFSDEITLAWVMS